ELFLRYPQRLFSAWQIELTTKCPLSCRMCIREGFREWNRSEMDIADFKRLAPYFKKTEHVILQGWGEPLLYGHLLDAVRAVKAEGAQAGFVTSGKGLNRGIISELIDSGIDFIGFSLAGATPKTHNSIRLNSDLDILLANIHLFNEIKKENKLGGPGLHIVYLLLRDNISETPALIELAKEIGIKDVIFTNLIHITNDWQAEQRVFTCFKSPENDYMEMLREAEIKAMELKINLRLPSLAPNDVPVCEENPLKNIYISVDGEVSPCVYLYPPSQPIFKRVYCGQEYYTEKVSFGNIFRESFSSIWDKKAYVEFRDCFSRRQEGFKKLDSLSPPQQCRTCHKMLGV
ncbi:MAG: radical SAM protein, partial [Nitrospirota bacterium]